MFSVQFEYYTVFLGWVITLCLGAFLLFFTPPEIKKYHNFHRAKNLCALVFLLFAGEKMTQWLLRFTQPANPMLSVSLYLLVYAVAAILMTISFSLMLLPEQLSRRRLINSALFLAGYVVLLLIAVFALHGRAQIIMIMVCAALLFIEVCVLLVTGVRIYRRAIQNLERYYSDYIDAFKRWMPGAGLGILMLELTAPIVCFTSRDVGICQELLSIALFAYTFICLINFAFYYTRVNVANIESQQDEAATTLTATCTHQPMSENLCDVMRDKHKRWQESGGFRTPGITVDEVARAMGTNRSYLSQYLNEVCNQTFYEWVRDMRIDDAKQFLTAHPELSIEQISTQVGFTSSSHFSSTFKKLTGLTPVQWRHHHPA